MGDTRNIIKMSLVWTIVNPSFSSCAGMAMPFEHTDKDTQVASTTQKKHKKRVTELDRKRKQVRTTHRGGKSRDDSRSNDPLRETKEKNLTKSNGRALTELSNVNASRDQEKQVKGEDTPKKKQVCFGDEHQVVYVERNSKKDRTKFWYRSRDFKQFRFQNYQTVLEDKLKQDSEGAQEGRCLRGLENFTPQGEEESKRVYVRKILIMQHNETLRHDSIRFAEIAATYSRRDRLLAKRLASQDEKEVSELYNESEVDSQQYEPIKHLYDAKKMQAQWDQTDPPAISFPSPAA